MTPFGASGAADRPRRSEGRPRFAQRWRSGGCLRLRGGARGGSHDALLPGRCRPSRGRGEELRALSLARTHPLAALHAPDEPTGPSLASVFVEGALNVAGDAFNSAGDCVDELTSCEHRPSFLRGSDCFLPDSNRSVASQLLHGTGDDLKSGNPVRVGLAFAGFAPVGTGVGALLHGIFREPGATAAVRLAQDVIVSRVAPRRLPLTRSIGRASHNRTLQEDLAALPDTAADIRIYQQQVSALGQRVGINRSDLQYTLDGKRYYYEYEGVDNARGTAHKVRILANDPNGVFQLKRVP
jgi:hypothetical protein